MHKLQFYKKIIIHSVTYTNKNYTNIYTLKMIGKKNIYK